MKCCSSKPKKTEDCWPPLEGRGKEGAIQLTRGKLSRMYQKMSSGSGPLYLYFPITWPTPRKEDPHHNREFSLHPGFLLSLDFYTGRELRAGVTALCNCSLPRHYAISAERPGFLPSDESLLPF